ncbi:MAG: hypothetical protein ACR2QH_16490 [Geminicoccaceae bacterium]
MSEATTAAVIEKLTAFTNEGPFGATMPLDAATNFRWDTVFCFLDRAPIESINAAVGQSVHLGEDVTGSLMSGATLLIFVDEDDIVDIIVVGPPLYLSGTPGKAYTPDGAVLVVQTKDPGPYTSLRFKE